MEPQNSPLAWRIRKAVSIFSKALGLTPIFLWIFHSLWFIHESVSPKWVSNTKLVTAYRALEEAKTLKIYKGQIWNPGSNFSEKSEARQTRSHGHLVKRRWFQRQWFLSWLFWSHYSCILQTRLLHGWSIWSCPKTNSNEALRSKKWASAGTYYMFILVC